MPDKTTPHILSAAKAIERSTWDTDFDFEEAWLSPDYENVRHNRIIEATSALSTTLEPSEEEIEAGAQAISLSFREEGFSAEHDDPSVWDEFKRASRECLIAAARVRLE